MNYFDGVVSKGIPGYLSRTIAHLPGKCHFYQISYPVHHAFHAFLVEGHGLNTRDVKEKRRANCERKSHLYP